MTTRPISWRSLLLAGVLLSATAASAAEHPNHARGFKPDHSFQFGDLDHVNLFNGNLVVTLPVGQSYPVGGQLSYGLALSYNSTVWDVEPYPSSQPGDWYTMEPFKRSNAGLGWLLSLGQLEFVGSPFPGQISRFVYRGADGAEHTFFRTLHPNETPTDWIFYTRDNTYLRLNENADPTTGTMELEFPDGTVHAFHAGGTLKQIRDRFGNFVNVTYPDGNWQLTDSHGRVQTVVFQNATQPARVVDQVLLTGFGTQTAVYDFQYADMTIRRACGSQVPDPSQVPETETVTMLTRIVLPDGSTFAPSYRPGNAALPCDDEAGLMGSVQLPTRGGIAWSYGTYSFPAESDSKPRRRYSLGVTQRRLWALSGQDLGTWNYTPQLLPTPATDSNPARLRLTTVTSPLNHPTVHHFSAFVSAPFFSNGAGWTYGEYGLPLNRDAPDGTGRYLSVETKNAAGTVLRSRYVRYERDAADTSHDSNRRQASSRTVYHDDGGTVADENLSDFDGLGHYRTRRTAGTFPGENVRTEFVNYNPGQGTYGQGGYTPLPATSPWITHMYNFRWDESQDLQLLFRSTCFDAGTGFLLGQRIHGANDGSIQTNNLIELFAHDGRGNLASERYYGGDAQPVTADPGQGAICAFVGQPRSPAGTALSAVYQLTHVTSAGTRSRTSVSVGGTTLRLLDLSIDLRTGLPSASRDTAGIQESYGYDALGRLTTIEPAGDPAVGTDPTDALTTYTYCTASSNPGCGGKAEVVVARKASAAGAEITATRLRFDDLGRLVSQEERMPPSGAYQARTFAYNGMGWRTFVSEQGASGGTSYLSYDPFGRPGTIRPADGAAHDVSLSYLGARQVQRTVRVATSEGGSESPATTTEVYDRFARLYEVTEPNGVKTRHDYDAGHRLEKVCQNATGAGTASCGQARFFAYDNHGLLRSEQHPEKGGSGGNGIVSYLNYDARGHALRRIDGPNDLTFTFDKAERMTDVRETAGLQRPLKSFTYGLGTAAPDYSKGKVKTAKRYNYVAAPFNATVEVQDTYTYGGREGRVSQHDTQMIYNGAPAEGFRQSPTWDNLGNIASQSYPDCVAGSCAALDAPRTVSFTYSYGRLATVPGFTGTATTPTGATVGQITYHPNGVVHQVPHANQMLYTVGRDLWGMARPSSFQASRGATIYWNTGTHSYDGAGNLEGTGEFTYAYDLLSRVVQSTMGGSGTTQGYTYDVYGNIQSITTSGSTVGTPTSSATNRLNLGSYDAAGNLLSWAGNLYEYDAFNQLKRYVAGAEDWRYIYTADDERFWSYRTSGGGSIWALRGLDGKVLRRYEAHLGWGNYEDYVYREGQLLAAAHTPVAPAPKTGMWHFHLDHLGTPRMVTNQNSGSIGFHRYYPFGQEQTALQEGETRKFTGHERDLANPTGTADDLDYMHARHYSPLTGRFLQTDSVGEGVFTPQAWNRYVYVMDRPLVYTDPYGLFAAGPGPNFTLGLGWANAFRFTASITVTGTPWPFGPVIVKINNPGFLSFLTFSNWLTAATASPDIGPSSPGAPESPDLPQSENTCLQSTDQYLGCLGDCIEQNRLDWGAVTAYAITNPIANLIAGGTGRSGFGGLKAHPTSWQHKVGAALSRATKNPWFSRTGKVVGRASLVPTVFEGFYDIGTIGRCAVICGGGC